MSRVSVFLFIHSLVFLALLSICSAFVAPNDSTWALRRRNVLTHGFWPFDKQDSPTGVAIIDAVGSRSVESVEAVLSRNRPNISRIVNERSPMNNDNAMHIIARKGHYKYPPMVIPKLLVDSGIDINATDGNGETALEISLLSGWQKIAMLLLDSGADRSVVTDSVKQRIRCPDCKRVVREYGL
jgi:ankyrin repeat protein